MRKVKELFAKHGVENADLLADVEQVVDSSGGIPQSRFKEVIDERNSLRAEKVELEAQIGQLNAKIEGSGTELERLKAIESEHNAYLETQHKQIIQKWTDTAKVFDVAETDPNFDKFNKIKPDFSFGDDVTPEQAQQNLKTYEIYQKAGFFGSTENPPKDDPPPRKGDHKTYKSPFDMTSG